MVFVLAGCSGGDNDETVVPAEWCQTTTGVFWELDHATAGASYDALQEWVDLSPDEIRGSVERVARVLRGSPDARKPSRFAKERSEIESFAREHCAT
jgi:hypothetical protein